jgi:hypothetical protein
LLGTVGGSSTSVGLSGRYSEQCALLVAVRAAVARVQAAEDDPFSQRPWRDRDLFDVQRLHRGSCDDRSRDDLTGALFGHAWLPSCDVACSDDGAVSIGALRLSGPRDVASTGRAALSRDHEMSDRARLGKGLQSRRRRRTEDQGITVAPLKPGSCEEHRNGGAFKHRHLAHVNDERTGAERTQSGRKLVGARTVERPA